MSSLRSERAKRRAKRQRNQRIAIIAVAALILIAVGYFVFQAYTSKAQPTPTEQVIIDNEDVEVITTASGLRYQDIIVGDGPEAKAGDTVKVHYTGWLEDDTKFDSSVDRGAPFEFTIGAGMVIQGWDEGVVGMKVGGKRKLIIPPDLGYGSRGAGAGVIPPNATLIFDIDLLEISGSNQ